MSSAKVTNVETLRDFKRAIDRFAQEVNGALGEVDMTAQRALSWLSHEQLPHWQREIRIRQEKIAGARAALLRKQLSSSLDDPTCIEERKALDKAKQALVTAEDKVKLVKKWLIMVDKEWTLYKGASQGLSDVAQRDMPLASIRLTSAVKRIEEYHQIATGPAKRIGESGGAGESSMARDGGDADDRGDVFEIALDESARQPSELAAVPTESTSAAADWTKLRRICPTPQGRKSTTAPGADQKIWGVVAEQVAAQMLPPEAPEGVMDMLASFAGEGPSGDHTVILAPGVLDGRDVFLLRQPGQTKSDSGWFIGPLEQLASGDPDSGLLAVNIAWLAERRPWIPGLLGLPVGYLVVIMGGAILAVLDENDSAVFDATGANGGAP